MKKLAFLCGVALALGFTACDDELPNPQPQTNPQLPIFESAGLVLSQAGYGANEALNLQAFADQGLKAPLADVTTLVDFPEGFELLFKVEMSDTEDFAKTVTIDATMEDSVVVVPASTINTAISETFTKNPAEITLYTRIAAYAQNGASTMRLGGKDALYGEYTYKIIPFTPDRLLEEAYVLRYNAGNGWQTMPMVKTTTDNVYDNGLFTAQVNVQAPGFEWTVLPASSATGSTLDGILGVAAADVNGTEGALVEGEEAVANVINKVSPFLITIDVCNLTYKVNLSVENLWVPGGATGTSNFNRVLKLFTTDYVNYSGTMVLSSNWYLTGQASNEGLVYMLDGEQAESEAGIYSGNLVQLADASGTKMSISSGLYFISVNLGTLRYSASPIKQISVIGQFNNWDLETAVDMTKASRGAKWTVKDLRMTAGEYKFCVDHAWALSFGGVEKDAVDDIRQNGANLTLDEDGVYDITLDFSKQPNKVTLTKK